MKTLAGIGMLAIIYVVARLYYDGKQKTETKEIIWDIESQISSRKWNPQDKNGPELSDYEINDLREEKARLERLRDSLWG